jgi:hypothetical protein
MNGVEMEHRGKPWQERTKSSHLQTNPWGWQGPLLEECAICNGTGRIIDHSVETNDSTQP